jgi:hypothetical protein
LTILLALAPSHASNGLWRTPDSVPGYQPDVNLDPRPPQAVSKSWITRAEKIETAAIMHFFKDWKGKKPIFNYYLVSECPDEDTNEVYRKKVREAIDMITHYRNKFVEFYPQFSYLSKLSLQLSDGPLDDNVFNIPILYTEGLC